MVITALGVSDIILGTAITVRITDTIHTEATMDTAHITAVIILMVITQITDMAILTIVITAASTIKEAVATAHSEILNNKELPIQ